MTWQQNDGIYLTDVFRLLVTCIWFERFELFTYLFFKEVAYTKSNHNRNSIFVFFSCTHWDIESLLILWSWIVSLKQQGRYRQSIKHLEHHFFKCSLNDLIFFGFKLVLDKLIIYQSLKCIFPHKNIYHLSQIELQRKSNKATSVVWIFFITK